MKPATKVAPRRGASRARPEKPGPTAAGGSAPSGSFTTLLRRFVPVALAVETAPGAGAAPAEPNAAFERAVAELETETALKLWTLAVAGAEARDIAVVLAAMPQGGSDPDWARAALVEQRSHLGESLRRGEAIACATGLDLDRPLADWPPAAERDLEARAWLSFARQLVSSPPSDWQCVAIADPKERQRISKLYLRLADQRWWSFRRLLDRPSAVVVDRERKRLRRGSGAADTLQAIATGANPVGGEALRRALGAIRARLGVAATSPRVAAGSRA